MERFNNFLTLKLKQERPGQGGDTLLWRSLNPRRDFIWSRLKPNKPTKSLTTGLNSLIKLLIPLKLKKRGSAICPISKKTFINTNMFRTSSLRSLATLLTSSCSSLSTVQQEFSVSLLTASTVTMILKRSCRDCPPQQKERNFHIWEHFKRRSWSHSLETFDQVRMVSGNWQVHFNLFRIAWRKLNM